MSYKQYITDSMTWLGQQKDTIFVGQALHCGGTFMSSTLEGVPEEKAIEFPVSESFNVQFAMGLALAGYTPIVIIPRMDFLLVAVSDIINMLDKFEPISEGKVKPHVLIRTALGASSPIDPGHQHKTDYRYLFADYCPHIKVYDVDHVPYEDNNDPYKDAYLGIGPAILIENGNLY